MASYGKTGAPEDDADTIIRAALYGPLFHRQAARSLHDNGSEPDLCGLDWSGESRYRLPRAHHKHLKSTNMLERLNEEIKRRTRVVRIFPHTESCLRLVRTLSVETHEAWLEDKHYLNTELLAEARRERLLATA